MDNKLLTSMVGAIAFAGAAHAGTEMAPVDKNPVPAPACGDWCETLQTIGTVYKGDGLINSVKFFGRAQLQYAYVDGEDASGREYNTDFEEVRRLRFGGEVKFLDGFKLKASVNLEDDQSPQGGDRDFGYQDFDTAFLQYTFKGLMGLDEASIGYGRYKVAVGHESHTSSKKIKTVERSALSNKVYHDRYSAVMLDAKKGDWTGTLGFLSLEQSEFVTGFSGGNALYASTGFKALGGDVLLDLVYNLEAGDSNADDEIGLGYEWVASAAWSSEFGNWDLMVNGVVGDNGDEDYAGADRDGLFYGLVVMPSTYIVADKLEFVARYQWQGSEEQNGIRLNSRYVRRAEGAEGLDLGAGGRGDSHHSLYAGLNWYQCGDNSKVMTGVEYETIDTENGSADATTLWLAYRMFF